MFKRFGVEIYFFTGMGLIIWSLGLSLININSEVKGDAWPGVIGGIGFVLFLLALVAADVRQHSLPTK